MRRFLSVPLLALALPACGSGRPPTTPAAAAAGVPSGEDAPRSSSTQTPSALAAAAVPAEATAETCKSVVECASVGLALAKKGDELDGAKTALGKACSGAIRSIDACAQLTALLADELGGDATRLAEAAHAGCSVFGADDGERALRASACALWGAALHEGRGAEKDDARAARAFDDGCKLGDARACKASHDLEREARQKSDAETGIQGANLRMGSVTTNGVRVEKIACRSDGELGGLVGSVALGKPFADRKSKLDACVRSARRTTRVRWSTAAGRMVDVKVISGDDPANKCIEKVLDGAAATIDGTCAASIALGR